jgi:GGDEF domain-containing protein
MERGVLRRRRPRPVVSTGVEALLLRTEELAKGWLLALVEDAPLDEAAAILAGDVARDGPRVCDAVVRAIYADGDLRRIEQEGVLEPLASRTGELAGAGSAEAAGHAVEALREVIWSALRGELAQADPELLSDAAERLSTVTGLVLAAVLRRRDAAEADTPGPARVAPLRVARADDPANPGDHPERRAVGSVRPGSVGTASPVVPSGAGGGTATGVGGSSGREAAAHTSAAGLGGDAAREEARDALWVGALRDEIVRAARASLPLSLLLVELDEAERLLAVEPQSEASATFGRFAQSVRTSVRRRDVLACETDSRAWIIARDTGRAGAQALGSRIASTVPAEGSWGGAPLTVSVGLAVLGEDGHNAAALIDAAEQTRFAAEASGVGIVTDDDGEYGPEPSGPDQDPAGPGPRLAG